MRVIAGQYRGRKLQTPAGLDTRPILDRVKVSLFDWLGAHFERPGTLPPLAVLDVFCGGGSLGIEALSRGAASCVFVDAGREAIAALRQNLSSLGVGREAQVVPGRAEHVKVAPLTGRTFDLVFLDPPYPLSREDVADSVMGRIAARFAGEIPVSDEALLLWRHDDQVTLPDAIPGGWCVDQRRSWSSMTITVYQRESTGLTE